MISNTGAHQKRPNAAKAETKKEGIRQPTRNGGK